MLLCFFDNVNNVLQESSHLFMRNSSYCCSTS